MTLQTSMKWRGIFFVHQHLYSTIVIFVFTKNRETFVLLQTFSQKFRVLGESTNFFSHHFLYKIFISPTETARRQQKQWWRTIHHLRYLVSWRSNPNIKYSYSSIHSNHTLAHAIIHERILVLFLWEKTKEKNQNK